jgi:Haemolymph juvenile hormone binding protein (JHBP)
VVPVTTGVNTVSSKGQVFWVGTATFNFSEGVRAKVYFKGAPYEGADGLTYLKTEQVKMDFSVKDIKMGVENISNGNSIIREYPSKF